MLVGVLLMIFASNIATFSNLIGPYIGQWINHVQKEVTKAARSKNSTIKADRNDGDGVEQSNPNDD